jgi:hypothetical protein
MVFALNFRHILQGMFQLADCLLGVGEQNGAALR